jgi:hypothetical protein
MRRKHQILPGVTCVHVGTVPEENIPVYSTFLFALQYKLHISYFHSFRFDVTRSKTWLGTCFGL